MPSKLINTKTATEHHKVKFSEAKQGFDNLYGTATEYECFLAEHLTFGRKTNFKRKFIAKNASVVHNAVD